ncbi:MAG: hypothetical protein K6G81_04625 [Lachnospiraceae bacterium]|nr:hypothetical protein [Lachnospiraceae bacterium]
MFLSVLILLAVLSLNLTGCKETAPQEDAVTTDFQADTVFAVGEKRVSLPEWYLYACPQIATDEAMYGSGIWDYQVSEDRGTLARIMKEDIYEQISYIKIVAAQAEKLGITLNEDEKSDIEANTMDYMSLLSKEQKDRYGITEDIVRSVYSDNVLAMKVYENLTLNIDTDIPDEQVRHMVIEYIYAGKAYETPEDTTSRYTDEELRDIRSRLDALYQKAVEDPSITRLSQLDNEQYGAVELVCDYSELKNRFPADIASKVFNMRENEILGVFDTPEAFFIIDCLDINDEDTTNAAKIAIIEQRQRDLFDREYAKWQADTVIKINYSVWDTITIE